jgi:hypothetical protein
MGAAGRCTSEEDKRRSAAVITNLDRSKGRNTLHRAQMRAAFKSFRRNAGLILMRLGLALQAQPKFPT